MDSFIAEGWVLLPELLTPAELECLGLALERCEGAAHQQGPKRQARRDDAGSHPLMNLHEWEPAFAALLGRAPLPRILSLLFGHDPFLASMNARVVEPGEASQGLHRDTPGSRSTYEHPQLIQVVWMLDGFQKRNGGTRVISGSHRWAWARRPVACDVRHLKTIRANAGSALVFDGRIWHGSGLNHTTARRRAVFAQYRSLDWGEYHVKPRPPRTAIRARLRE
ncbi:MAG: phytanoyl-CoA dioxygenase family protein [Dehalococcoidia bacterium]|nr:phytanoyl-CoA dioxygenase family protein [Dehalococcoidia bacterium]